MPRPWSTLVAVGVTVGVLAGVTRPSDALADSKLLARGRVEHPDFIVVERGVGFELRRYQPRLVAEVEVRGAPQQATNAGFRILADFIFGNNTRAEDVAMTSPVDRRPAGDRWVITFTMPSKYTRDTLPRPNDARVRIRELPAAIFAVRQFTGSPDEDGVQAEITALREAVVAAGHALAEAPPIYSRYDPPWTPASLRRNEVMLPIARLRAR